MKKTLLILICTFCMSTLANAQLTRDEITQNVIKNFVKKDYAKVQQDFSGTLKNKLSQQQLQDAWEGVIAEVGNYISVLKTTEYQSQGYNVVKKRLQFKIDNRNLEVTFNEDDKIIGLYFKY